MRLNISSARLMVAVLIIAAMTGSFTFADSPDACLLLTQAQVSGAVGVAFGAGTHVTPEFLQTCTWTPTTSPKDIKAVTLNIQPGDTYDSSKKHVELAATAVKGTQVKPTNGIGDDAYYMTTGPGIMQLFFKKETLAFKIAIYGAISPEKAMAVEKTLALEVISKL